MHLSLSLFAAATITVGLVNAHANTHANTRLNPRTHSILSARQLGGDGGTNVDQFPAECIEKCTPYVQVGAKCAGIGDDGQNTSSSVSEEDIMKCACTPELFNGMIACINCAPSTFASQSDFTPKQIVDMALAECARAGFPVTGVNEDSLATTAPTGGSSSGGGGGGASSSVPAPVSSSSSSSSTTRSVVPISGQQQSSTAVTSGTTSAATTGTTTAGTPGNGTGAAVSAYAIEGKALAAGLVAALVGASYVLLF